MTHKTSLCSREQCSSWDATFVALGWESFSPSLLWLLDKQNLR